MAAGRGRSRRVSIPGVAELLRPVSPEPVLAGDRAASGREKHDHKITVYLSAGELLDLEHARLALRRQGVVIDRGRLVREAVAVLLADLDARGPDSLLARRLAARQHAGGSHDGASGDGDPGDGASSDRDDAAGQAGAAGQVPAQLPAPGLVPEPALGEPSASDLGNGAVPSLTWQ